MPCVSIIIPVYNEQRLINNLILHLKTIFRDKDAEIIVVDGCINKSTIKEIKENSITTISGKTGRAAQMNLGAKKATGEILFFLHADSRLPENAFHVITNLLRNKNIKAGAFDLEIDSKNRCLKMIEKIASLRSKITKIPYGDQGIFIKKNIFHEINGFSQIPLMEDIDLMLKLKKKDYKISILREKIMTSPRRWERQGVVYCSLRNIILASLFYLGADPSKLAKYY